MKFEKDTALSCSSLIRIKCFVLGDDSVTLILSMTRFCSDGGEKNKLLFQIRMSASQFGRAV